MADRRTFLKQVGVLGGALVGGTLFGSCTSSTSNGRGRPDPTSAPLLHHPARSSPITHVVVVMLENRSFDHWLGWLAADAAYLEAGRRRYGRGFTVDGRVQQSFLGPGGELATFHLPERPGEADPWRGCGHPDPGHSWEQGRVQRDHGFLADGSGNDSFACGYYQAADLPFTAQLARRFTVCDRSFASLLGSTFPNREYLHSAQSGGLKDNTLPPAGGFSWPTVWDRLAQARVPAGYYYTDLPVTFLWGSRYQEISHKVDDYFTACEQGTLPNVSFVDPGFLSGSRTDNHPLGDIRAGERFLRDVFGAFARSRHWRSGLFVLTYDEWGGFFEHVRPARFADDRASAVDADDFGQAGFRVPTILASPFARPGFVDHRPYEHTSILRFLAWRFLGAPAEGPGPGSGRRASWALTTRDRRTHNLGGSLTTTARPDVGFDLDVAIASPSAACPGEIDGLAFDADGGEVHPFELVHRHGYFDALGADTVPSPLAKEWVTV